MSVDPYHAVQADIQTSLQAASSLRSSFLRIRSTASKDSEELRWVGDEVCDHTLDSPELPVLGRIVRYGLTYGRLNAWSDALCS
jgi:Syntaxin 6, N-terminal